MLSSLPTELITQIIHCVDDDPQNNIVRTCCLVCKQWLTIFDHLRWNSFTAHCADDNAFTDLLNTLLVYVVRASHARICTSIHLCLISFYSCLV